MLNTKIHPKKLAFYCQIAFAVVMSTALALYFLFSDSGSNPLTLSRAVHYSVMFLTYGISWIFAPFLIIRSLYFFLKMVRHGRRQDVGLFSFKFLFNPLNLLIFSSLLTSEGRIYRRRCLVSFILFILMLALMLSISRFGG